VCLQSTAADLSKRSIKEGEDEDSSTDDLAFEQPSVMEALSEIVMGKGILSLCLLAMPVSLWAVHFGWSDTWIFWLNFTVMIPLASILGDFTEEVAQR